VTVRRCFLIGGVALVVAALLPAAGGTTAPPTPTARVGAFYFDGWAGPLTSFHFGGLLGTPYAGRRPLSGWRDDASAALQAQLRWAHADGIGFFAFDWYYKPDPGNGPINLAHDTYLRLPEHDGVGFALTYVNQPGFVIPPDQWASVADQWVTEDFLNTDYVRIDGKPLLIILDERFFNLQMGGAAGVNAAIATLQDAAKRHGLPGVFVVGGRYLSWTSESCFPKCLDTDGDFPNEHYDAITEFSYPYILEPEDGPRPYPEVAAAIKRMWDVIAQRSPFPHIPSVMAGFDARPMVLSGQVQPPDQGGWPLLLGHETWFVTSPADVGGLVRDAVDWVQANPSMRVEPAPAPPVVLVQSWNELQEGAIIVPTDQDGYSYGQAIAQSVGIPWTPPPKHTLSVTPSPRGTVTSTPAGISCPPTCSAGFDEGLQVTLTAQPKPGSLLDRWSGCTDADPTCSVILVRDSTAGPVFLATVQRRTISLRLSGHLVARGTLSSRDGFDGCVSYERLEIQRRQAGRWARVAAGQTENAGRYTIRLRDRSGAYRASVPQDTVQGHTCLAASSRTVAYGR
jgi:hypothetical protein